VNLPSAVQVHDGTFPFDVIDGCYAIAACLPDDLTYYMMPLLLALWSRDRFRLAGFLSDNRQSVHCQLFAWNIRPEFPSGVRKAFALIRGFARPITDEASETVDRLISETVPTDAIAAALDPICASEDLPD
jgi:hypothetical protein